MKPRATYNVRQNLFENILIKSVVKSALLLLVLLPLTYLFFLHIQADFLYGSAQLFYKLLLNDKLLNSFVLAVVVAGVGTLLACGVAMLYFHIYNKRVRFVFGIFLGFLFFLAPIIYASLFSQLESFQHLGAFARSVIVLLMWLSPLGSAIVIVSMGSMDRYSFEILKFIPVSTKDILYTLLLKQMFPVLIGVFILLFLMTFTQEEVPSFFGYRTYAEEFLSRIVLQEEFESTLFYALPFIVISFVAFIIFAMLLRYKSVRLRENIYALGNLEIFQSRYLLSFTLGMIFVSVVLFLYLVFENMDTTLFISSFEQNLSVVFRSVFLSVFASLLVTAVSVFFVMQCKTRTNLLVLICVTSLYWLLPSSLNALVLLQFSQYVYIQSEWYSYFLLIYAYVLRVLPIGLIIAAILYKRVEYNPARFVTISSYKEFVKITLPQNYKGWLIIFVIAFFLLLNEITTTVLLVEAGFETIIVKIYNLLHYGDLSQILFLSLMQILIVLFGLIVFICIKGTHGKA